MTPSRGYSDGRRGAKHRSRFRVRLMRVGTVKESCSPSASGCVRIDPERAWESIRRLKIRRHAEELPCDTRPDRASISTR